MLHVHLKECHAGRTMSREATHVTDYSKNALNPDQQYHDDGRLGFGDLQKGEL